MTKLGTPIGAGPKGAIVVVGLASGRARRRRRTGSRRRRLRPAAGRRRRWRSGRSTPPPELPPPLESPRLSLWVTPPLVVVRLRLRVAVDRAALLEPAGLDRSPAGVAAVGGQRSAGVAALGAAAGAGASLVPVGEVQSGSARSIRPSPSSSTPLAQAGACSEGTAVVVVPAAWFRSGVLSATGSAPAIADAKGETAPGSWRVRLSVRSWLSSQCASVPAATERGICVRTLPARQASPRYLFAQGRRNGASRPPTRP